MLHGRLAAAMAFVLLLAGVAGATTYNWTGGTGGNWSDTTQWDVGGSYPSTKDDVGILDAHNDQVTYDAASSGVCGGMQLKGRMNSQRIYIDRDVLLDYTGTTGVALTPAGWLYTRADDNYGSYVEIKAGKTLTLTGWKAETDKNAGRFIMGSPKNAGGTLKFAPDAGGKGYLYFGYDKTKDLHYIHVDFSALTTIECMNLTGTGVIEGSLSGGNQDNTNAATSRAWTVGRTDGATQTFAAKASVAGTASGRVISLKPAGMSGRYGPKLVVNAVGTDASPNLVVFEKEALGGLSFGDNSSRADGGSWVEASGAGVARLVIEGNFTTADNSDTDTLWDMSQIQVHMAGETPASQLLRWCGADKHAGGTGDLMDFAGLDNNYAVRRLVIGSDEGTAANHVDFDTSAAGSALYCYGLEFVKGGYLEILNADDYVYFLGNESTYNGIAGGGLVMPPGKPLSDFTNRPENIIMLGEGTVGLIPEPTALGLIGISLLALRRRRKAMRKLLCVLLACVLLASAAASAGVVKLGEWAVDQDNYNNTLNVSQNRGGTDGYRAAKNKQETTWYGDWSDADLADLEGQMAVLSGGGGIYGTDYWVEFWTATNDWGMNGGASFTPEVSAFLSKVDWVENQATNNVASSGVSWFRHDTGAGVQFWGLVDIDNSAPVVGGWQTSSVYNPRNISWSTAVLDWALVNAVVSDANCRGLRMWDDAWYNDANMAKERWGGAGAPRLVLYYSEPEIAIIPEPAGLSLLGLALLGLRKRRS